jgi:trk system potassium uptake protein TrkA
MAQQALVVGLGQFGMALAQALTKLGSEVLVVDRRAERVQLASSFATEAVTIDAMDEAELARLRPASRDLCVCAIGDENREASIVVTAMLRQMGAPRLVARATDAMHERILTLVGAHEVLNPERTLGERLAARLSSRGVIDVLPLGDDLAITEIATPPSAVGRTLAEIQLPKRFQLTVLGVRRAQEDQGKIVLPTASLKVYEGDIVVVVGPIGAARRFAEGS